MSLAPGYSGVQRLRIRLRQSLLLCSLNGTGPASDGTFGGILLVGTTAGAETPVALSIEG